MAHSSLAEKSNEHWQRAPLGELLPIKYGKSLPEKARDAGGTYPVFGSSGRVGVHSAALTTGPTLVIGRKGNVGAVHYSTVPCWPIDTVYYVEATACHNLRYYKYLLDSLNLAKLDRSTAIPGLSRDDYNALEVVVAPPEEQEAIVAEIEKQFSRLDEAVANLKRVKANLKRYKAAVLKAAVEGRLVPTEAELARREGRSYENGVQLLQRILDTRRSQWNGQSRYKEPAARDRSDVSELPEGWAWTSVECVGDVLLGRQRAPQYLTGRYRRPYLRVANIKDDRIDFSDLEEMDFDENHFPKYRLEPGDILVSEGQSPELLGQSAIFRGFSQPLCFQKTLHRFRPVAGSVSSEFAQTVFRSHTQSGIFRKLGSITTNIAHLTLEKFKAAPFPLPPLAEQRRIVAECDRRLSLVRGVDTEVDANLKRAKRLRQAVLARLLGQEMRRA